jgi:hypothetical protein
MLILFTSMPCALMSLDICRADLILHDLRLAAAHAELEQEKAEREKLYIDLMSEREKFQNDLMSAHSQVD